MKLLEMEENVKLWWILLLLSSLCHRGLTQDLTSSTLLSTPPSTPTSALVSDPSTVTDPPATNAPSTSPPSPERPSTTAPPPSVAQTTKGATVLPPTTAAPQTQKPSATSRGGDGEQQPSISTVSKQREPRPTSTSPQSREHSSSLSVVATTTSAAPSHTQETTTRLDTTSRLDTATRLDTTTRLDTATRPPVLSPGPKESVTTNNQGITVTNAPTTTTTMEGSADLTSQTIKASPDHSRTPEKPGPDLAGTTTESRVQTTVQTTPPSSRATAASTTTTAITTAATATTESPEIFRFSLNADLQPEEHKKEEVAVCRQLMVNMDVGHCVLIYRHHNQRLEFDSAHIEGDVKISIVRQIYEDITKKPTDNRTLITILVSCGALLLMIITLAVCASHHRKPYSETQHLTDELQTVENGYHDNPTLEVMEVQGAEPEKKINLNLNGEFNDNWIVPMDNLLKEEGPDEEDTHL